MRQWVLTEKNLNEIIGRLKKFFFNGRNKNFIINTPYCSTPGYMGGQVVDFYNLGPIDIYTVKNDSIVFEFANCCAGSTPRNMKLRYQLWNLVKLRWLNND